MKKLLGTTKIFFFYLHLKVSTYMYSLKDLDINGKQILYIISRFATKIVYVRNQDKYFLLCG